jgi:hypothetical protein
VAEPTARSLEEYLNGIEGVDEAVVAGSCRRRQDEAREGSVPIINEDEFASFLQDRGVEPSREG